MKYCITFITLCLLLVSASQARNAPTKAHYDPMYYIDLAEKFSETDPEGAKQALFKAFNLLDKDKDRTLMIKVLVKQASIAKTVKNYSISLSFLSKAQILSDEVDHEEGDVNLELLILEVNIYQLRAEIKTLLKVYDEAVVSVDKGIDMVEQSGDNPALLERLFKMRGDIYKKDKKYHMALRSYLLAQRHIHSQPNKAKVKLWRDIAAIYAKVDNNYSAIKYLNYALTLLAKDNNSVQQMKVLLDISRAYKKVSAYKNALSYGHRSLNHAKALEHEEFLLKSLLHLSIIYRRLSSFDTALEYGLQALNIYKKNADQSGVASSYNAIGLIYNQLNQKEKAKLYFEKVVALPRDSILPKYYAAALRELGVYHYSQQDYIKALELSNKAHDIYAKNSDVKGRATVKKNLGLIYQGMGSIESAFNSFKYGIEAAKKVGDPWGEASNLAHIADLYSNISPEKAKKWAKKSLKIAKKTHAKSVIELIYSALISAEETSKNYKQALHYAKLQASLINESKTDAIHKRAIEMHILQDVDTKTYELELLKQKVSSLSSDIRDKQGDISRLRVSLYDEQQSSKRFIWITLLVSIVVLVAFTVSKVLKSKGGRVS